ncbi:unnamed protein product [Prunus armeniaca]
MQPQGLGAGAATHDSAAIHDHLNAISGYSLVLEEIHSLPPLQPHLTYAPMYTSNGTLVHLPLGPIHTSIPDPRSQLLKQINLGQDLGAHDEERRIREHTGEHFEGSQTSQSETNWQGRERDRADETQTSASCTLSRSTIHSRLRSQEARARELLHDERNDRRSLTCLRTNSRRQLMGEFSQAQSTNLPHGQGNEGGQPLQVDEEVNHPCLNHEGRQ